MGTSKSTKKFLYLRSVTFRAEVYQFLFCERTDFVGLSIQATTDPQTAIEKLSSLYDHQYVNLTNNHVSYESCPLNLNLIC